MLQISGHHLVYNITYNGPYVSATPMFIGTEPPEYFSTGTDLSNSSTTAATENAYVVGTNIVSTTSGGGGGGPGGGGGSSSSTTYPGDFLVSYPYDVSAYTTYYRTATAAASILARTNVTATTISGATSSSYTIASPTTADNGFYYCVVTNSSGTTTSNTVVMTVTSSANSSLYNSSTAAGTSPKPVITVQPVSKTVVAGTSTTFSLTATSTTTATYQWYKIAATHRAPLETQRAAVSALATSIQADTTNASAGLLTGQTFSDVVLGVTNSGDGNFPFIGTTPTYPTGTTARGVLYTSLTTAEQAQVVTMIEAWVNTQASDISASLLADYLSPTALAQTYVGYQVGSGIADGGTAKRCNFDASINQEILPLNSQNSYLRVDGPRVWIEMVVQAAVAYKSNGFVHYHSLWRDKLADYGNEFGGYLDTTSTSTTYTRPSFTTQPASVTGSSATFTAVATANSGSGAVTPVYQWYNASGAISGATGASYTTTTAGSYYVTATTVYGTTASNTVTLTLPTVPAITTQPTSQSDVTGTSASFSVTASSTATLSYQWYFGGVAISGATGSTYTIAQTTSASAGSYYVIVTNSTGSTQSATVTLTLTEPLAVFLSTYGLSGVPDTTDSDGDGISNLLEFVLGGNPTVSNTSILPTSSYTTTGGVPTLVYSFYTVANLGSVVWTVEYSTDLSTWTTAVNGTNGVTITTTAYNSSSNLNVVTIPDSSTGQLFARLRATLPIAATSASTASKATTPATVRRAVTRLK